MLKLLNGKPASEMFNFRSPSFKQLGLEKEKLGSQDMIELMLKEPRLIKRPVLSIGDRVFFGAGPSTLEKLFN
jgi:arsenate reductase-like glutaredoxin family protein